MITGTIESLTIRHDHCPWHSLHHLDATKTTVEVDMVVEEISGPFRDGEYVYLTKHKPGSVQDIFTEACDNAKTGDTNALAALPYLAELLIKESNR